MTDAEFEKLNPCIFADEDKSFTKEMLLKQGEFFKTHTFIFKKLHSREVEILKLRCGLVDGRCITLKEIGNMYGACQQSIGVTVKNIFKKLGSSKLLPLLRKYDDTSYNIALNERYDNDQTEFVREINTEVAKFIKNNHIELIKNIDLNVIDFIDNHNNDVIKDKLKSDGIYTLNDLIKYLTTHNNLKHLGLGVISYNYVISTIDRLIGEGYLKINELANISKYKSYKSVVRRKKQIAEYDNKIRTMQRLNKVFATLNYNPELVTLDQLDLSARTYNCLRRSNLTNVKQILTFYYTHEDGFSSIKNLGDKSINELKEIISNLNKINDFGV